MADDGQGRMATPNPQGDTASAALSLREAESKGLSKEQIEELGHAAATALSEPMWKMAFEMTLNQLTASWLQSDENETQKRESLYLQAKNLSLLEEMLVGVVNQLQGENLLEVEKAEQDLNRYLDIQGWNLEDVPGFEEDPTGSLN